MQLKPRRQLLRLMHRLFSLQRMQLMQQRMLLMMKSAISTAKTRRLQLRLTKKLM